MTAERPDRIDRSFIRRDMRILTNAMRGAASL